MNLASRTSDPEFGVDLEVLGIVSVNREEWLATDLACNLLDITSVPLYETLGDEMLNLILRQTEMKTLFGSDVCLRTVLKTVKGNPSSLKQVVSFDPPSPQLTELALDCSVQILLYKDLVTQSLGKPDIDCL